MKVISNLPSKLLSVSLFIITFLLLSPEIFSQENQIQARIIDAFNNQPVSFVTVFPKTGSGVISDETGFFRFHFSEDQIIDSLYFSCIGYQTIAVAFADIQKNALDSILLSPHLFHLDEVEVVSKHGRTPKSKQIIKQAIYAIPENYPNHPVKFNGYYREYVTSEGNPINLLESIVELSDSGINTKDDFAAGLLYKRSSPDFQMDPGLMKAYDNVDKFVPYLYAPNITSNELVLLRSHDPVRNFDKTALYHIDNLQLKFVKNHKFGPPMLTYLDETPYYAISFNDKKPLRRGNKDIVTEGTIYIDAINYGIKKLNYQCFARDNDHRKKLFELSLEYKLHKEQYYLHYLSFNNLFMTRNFSLADFHTHSDVIDLTFNQPFDTTGLTMDDFRIFWKDQELFVRDFQIFPDSNQVKLQVEGADEFITEVQKQNFEFIDADKGVVHDNHAFISKHMDFEITNMVSMDGNPLEQAGFKEYNQYRELFVRDFQTDNTLITENLIQKQKPVFETRIFGEMIADTFWMNTPLLPGDLNSRDIPIENPITRAGIENLFNRNEKIVNEMVYIHTDREVYAPADTVWFKAYIRDLERLDTSVLSQTLFVKLVNDEGIIMDQARFLIVHSDAHGQFTLDHKLEEGVYYITAHSSWMQNYDTDQLYVKKILIRNEQRQGFQLELALDRNSYYKGDTIRAAIHCYDELNRDVEEVRYSYHVFGGKNTVTRGRAKTSHPLMDTIKFAIPDQVSEIPFIRISGTHKGQILDTMFRLPVIQDVHVDFFPEGGHSINGLECNIAFKAQTLHGDPIQIKGNIIDQDETLITTAESEHEGMGAFAITPDRSNQLYMQLTDPPGLDTLYPIPGGLERGWQLSGKAEGDSITLEVKRQDTPDGMALITLMVRGHLSYYKQIRVKKSKTVHIPLTELPAGIAVVTLFDHAMEPRAERLFYVNPTGEVGVKMESNRHTYIPRDKVSLNINLSSGKEEQLKGSFSLSIVDEQLCMTDFIWEPNIRSTFLLSPEIKGTIHNPNYYLDEDVPEVSNHLELLLLTQGWRNYSHTYELDWEHQVKQPKNRESISGTLLNQPFGKDPVTSAGEINVFFGGNSVKIPVNQNGRFEFTPEYDTTYNSGILISAKTNPASDYTILRIDEPIYEKKLPGYLTALMDSLSKVSSIPVLPYRSIADQFSLGLTYFQWIDEVEIVKAGRRMNDDEYDAILEDFIVMKKRESRPEFLVGAIDLIGVLYNMGIPVNYDPVADVVMHLTRPRVAIGWVVDHSYYGTSYSFVQNFSPQSIEKLYVVKDFETQYYGANISEVVVSIILKRFDPDDHVSDPYLSKHNIAAFDVPKEFYKPIYNTEVKRKSMIPDLRKTIHWDPDIEIGADGNTTVEFYNGDRYTNIKCILEGITDQGVPVYEEFDYNVSLSRD